MIILFEIRLFIYINDYEFFKYNFRLFFEEYLVGFFDILR